MKKQTPYHFNPFQSVSSVSVHWMSSASQCLAFVEHFFSPKYAARQLDRRGLDRLKRRAALQELSGNSWAESLALWSVSLVPPALPILFLKMFQGQAAPPSRKPCEAPFFLIIFSHLSVNLSTLTLAVWQASSIGLEAAGWQRTVTVFDGYDLGPGHPSADVRSPRHGDKVLKQHVTR